MPITNTCSIAQPQGSGPLGPAVRLETLHDFFVADIVTKIWTPYFCDTFPQERLTAPARRRQGLLKQEKRCPAQSGGRQPPGRGGG